MMGARGQRVSPECTQAGLPPRLLLLHGGRHDPRVEQLAQRLAQIGMPRMLGFDDPAPFDRHLARAMALVEGEPPVLMGYGYGAALALEVARQSDVHRLVLIEPLLFDRAQGEPSTNLERARALASRTIELSRMGEQEGAAAHYAQLLGLPADAIENVPASAAQLVNLARVRVPDGHGAWGAIDAPVVIVRGQNSPWLTRHAAARIASAFSGSRLFDVARAGHDLPFTHMGELAFILRRAVLASLELV